MALEGIPDRTTLIVNAAETNEPEFVEQVITSTGFGIVHWGDGYGLEPDIVFALNCHVDMLSRMPRDLRVRSEQFSTFAGRSRDDMPLCYCTPKPSAPWAALR